DRPDYVFLHGHWISHIESMLSFHILNEWSCIFDTGGPRFAADLPDPAAEEPILPQFLSEPAF
ncbi:MAG TPA: hypothetical protein VGR96_01505, partial [Acidobacteriaceae bacterium]|nr:hypothetical protein [Acidobacteriaceae bacterium]